MTRDQHPAFQGQPAQPFIHRAAEKQQAARLAADLRALAAEARIQEAKRARKAASNPGGCGASLAVFAICWAAAFGAIGVLVWTWSWMISQF